MNKSLPLVFGDKAQFAIEISRLDFLDGIAYGTIAMYVDGNRIGRPEGYEQFFIAYTLLKEHFSDANNLVDEELDAMPGQEILETVYRFVHDENAPHDRARSRHYYRLELGPASADWWDPFFIVTLRSRDHIRFVWAVFSGRKLIGDFCVPTVICNTVLTEFFAWFDALAS